jgi:glycosyltransferase involved in cell wall biosynthesis
VTTPEVSVILPSRDRPELLRRSLACALGQEGVELEVVVVDDGSAMPLGERVPDLHDPRVRLLRHDVARGVASARNAGIAGARGPLVAFLDDDDVWSPRKLAAQVCALDRSGAGFSYTDMLWLDGELHPFGTHHAIEPERLREELRLANVIGSPSTVVARVDAVRAVGGFDERLSVLADWELWIRLADAAASARVDQPLLGYVVHGAGLHVTDSRGVRSELRIIRQTHPGTPQVGGLDFWEWLASSQRRVGNRFGAARTHAHIALEFRRKRDLARAVGLVLGPWAMRLGRRPTDAAPTPVPGWLVDLDATVTDPAAASPASSFPPPGR